MSDKDRKKKDGQDKNKKNRAAREAANTRKEKAASPQQAKDTSNLTDRAAGAATSNRRKL
jgi:hypothetical protein